MSKTSERVKEMRTQRKLTQKDLAKLINSTSVTISRIESGTRNPSYALLSLIAERLNTNIEYLAGTSDNSGYEPINYKSKAPLSPSAFVPSKNQFVDKPTDLDNLLNAKQRFFISDVKLNNDEYKQVQDFINYLLWKREDN